LSLLHFLNGRLCSSDILCKLHVWAAMLALTSAAAANFLLHCVRPVPFMSVVCGVNAFASLLQLPICAVVDALVAAVLGAVVRG
jgi:hypothetical protein